MAKKKKKLDRVPAVERKSNDLYGEFIPTNFGWIMPDEQRKRAEDHEKLK